MSEINDPEFDAYHIRTHGRNAAIDPAVAHAFAAGRKAATRAREALVPPLKRKCLRVIGAAAYAEFADHMMLLHVRGGPAAFMQAYDLYRPFVETHDTFTAADLYAVIRGSKS